jgi:uncharacterized protein (DUF885 family)
MRAFAFILIAAAAVPAAAAPAPSFDSLAQQFYDNQRAFDPIWSTSLGLHDHDRELPDFSAAAVERRLATLRKWRERFAALDASKLSPSEAIDLSLVKMDIESNLLELGQRQMWRHNPDFYPGTAVQSVYGIIKRNFASATERLQSVIAREQKIPALLAEAKKNLREVPKSAVDIALEELPANIDFLRNDAPAAFAELAPPLKAQLGPATEAAVAALTDYQRFLEREVKPHAVDSFAIGEALFSAKLKADEGVTTPLDELLKRGEAELHRLQAEFKATAAKVSPGKPASEAQSAISREHGKPATLVADVQARLAGLRRFLLDHDLVTIPSEVMPRVQESPPFMRALTMASMDTPGPFEKANEAYYNVTLPDPKWPAARAEDYMRGAFNRFIIDVVSIHEAFPGHYLQFVWLPHVASRVRKYYGCSSNAEGWAHYTEQMMLDEGYGEGPKLRLAQLQDALLRAARYVAGIRMHTRGMTLEQAIDFFQKEGLQSKAVAEMEAKRGTEDPTYLYYTLGKLEILKLREDYKRKLGPQFTLRKFHDALLAEGAIPLPLMRKVLVGD